MKYEHTLVMTAELSKIIDADYSDDLSERFAGAMKKLLGMVVDNVNVVRCQDFIRETNEEEDQGDWIRFDPEDQLTWPPLNVLVLTQSKTGRFGLEKLLDWKYGDGGIKWFDPNVGGVGPIDMNIAWRPLPDPYGKEVDAK